MVLVVINRPSLAEFGCFTLKRGMLCSKRVRPTVLDVYVGFSLRFRLAFSFLSVLSSLFFFVFSFISVLSSLFFSCFRFFCSPVSLLLVLFPFVFVSFRFVSSRFVFLCVFFRFVPRRSAWSRLSFVSFQIVPSRFLLFPFVLLCRSVWFSFVSVCFGSRGFATFRYVSFSFVSV